MKIVKISAVLCLSTLTSLVFAAQPGVYIGGGLGASKLEIAKDFNRATQHAESQSKMGGLGGRIFGGYNFNRYFGIEAGVARYAPSTNDTKLTSFMTESRKFELTAIDVVGKAYLPISTSGFNLYALGGIACQINRVTIDTNYDIPDNKPAHNSYIQRDINAVYGIGASYDIPQTSLSTNLELSRIQGSGNIKTDLHAIPTADMVSLNLAFNFS